MTSSNPESAETQNIQGILWHMMYLMVIGMRKGSGGTLVGATLVMLVGATLVMLVGATLVMLVGLTW